MNSFLESGKFRLLLITFANSLDQGQGRSGSKRFAYPIVLLKEFFEKINFE